MSNQKKALVVDQDWNSRHPLSIRLEDMGFKVLEAENRDQVQKVLERGPVDVVIADWELPDCDHQLLLEMLKPTERPVFLFTDEVVPEPFAFLQRTQVKAIVPKKRRYELLIVLVKVLKLLPPVREHEAAAGGMKRIEVPLDPLSERTVPSGTASKHILVVEDSKAIRLFMRRALEGQQGGVRILEAGDGREALEKIDQEGVDIIVTDLEMPGMNGREFLRQLRERPHLKNKPVLVLSACSLRELKEEFKGDPNVRFLLKPSTAEQILEALAPFLGAEQVIPA